MANNIRRINPPSLPDASHVGYSQISVVEPGRIAYVSGQVAVTYDNQPVRDGLADQTRIVVSNLRRALDALGASPADVALMRIFIVGLDDHAMQQSFPIVLEFLAGAQPCITGIGVSALAGPNLKIEVEMTVRVPDLVPPA